MSFPRPTNPFFMEIRLSPVLPLCCLCGLTHGFFSHVLSSNCGHEGSASTFTLLPLPYEASQKVGKRANQSGQS